jgi:membrane fusion protein, multidrug efflux system
MASRKKWISLTVLLLLVAVGAVWGYARWRHGQIHVVTDNAYVKGKVHPVASKVPGSLVTVNVEDNQEVKAGDVIATLDPRDFDMAVERAGASLAEAEAALATDRAQIAQAKAQLEAALSQRGLTLLELERAEALFKRQSIPKQRFDQASAAKETADAQVESARKAISASEAKLTVSARKSDTARASLDNAKLQRTYCTITAPVPGTVSRKSAEPGMVVAPGQPLCAIVPLDSSEIWVEANFKETQLRRVKPGQRVTLEADLDPSRKYTGRVDSISAGTGAAFSLLPPENATGNWVKVVQRLPVKITFDPGQDPDRRLRVGMTVTVEIDTTSGR